MVARARRVGGPRVRRHGRRRRAGPVAAAACLWVGSSDSVDARVAQLMTQMTLGQELGPMVGVRTNPGGYEGPAIRRA